MTMGPLKGIRVVELASLAPAPFGCMMLADMGAEVIRVDRLGGSAAITPPAGPLDRGRSTVAVNLKTTEGVRAVHRLAADADVFVEGFRPGVAERLGVGPDALIEANPRLVYARMTGWGQDGPLRDRAGHDINYLALAGLLEPLARNGERPAAPMNLLADFAGGGMVMALGIVAALVERQRSGKGQVVDAAMVDGTSLYSAFLRGMHAHGMWNGVPGTNMLDGAAPFYDTYRCADDRFVAVGCVEPQFFAELVSTLGIDDRDLPGQHDPAGWDDWRSLLQEVFAGQTRDEWAELFADSDACVTPVLSPWEAPEHPHHKARGSFIELGGVVQPAPAPRFSRSTPATPVAADDRGRDVAQTLQQWGFSEPETALLLASATVD
ncbi:CaiB/BaiF CoA transferase family protein [Dietzia maris]